MMALLRSRWFIVGVGLLLMAYLLIFRTNATRQLDKKQQALLEAFESGDWDEVDALVSPAYADPWDWTGEELVLAMKDVRSQFLTLDVTLRDPQLDVAGGTGTVIGFVHAEGRGFGLADTAMARLNRLDAPFTFVWEKTSFWPWSWQLISLSHPDFEEPEAYRPGELLESRQRQMGF